MTYFQSNKAKQIVALVGIIVLALFLIVALSDFIPSFLGAIIFYIICSPLVIFLRKKFHFGKTLAITTVLLLSLVIVLIPAFAVTNMLISKLSIMLQSYDIYSEFQHLNSYINLNYGIDILSQQNITKLQIELTNFIPNLFQQTLSLLANIVIMYFMLFYMLFSETFSEKMITKVLPYTTENSNLFAKELVSQTYSNVIGAPVLAILQSLFAMFGFWIFGLNEPVFWGIMCGFLSFIPFVGSALIWLPAGLIQLGNATSWQGWAILIYGLVVIVNVDNVFRFMLQKKIGNIHPLVTVFGVIVGLEWFGLPGLIFGPLLISYLLIMVKVYNAEYGAKKLF